MDFLILHTTERSDETIHVKGKSRDDMKGVEW